MSERVTVTTRRYKLVRKVITSPVCREDYAKPWYFTHT
jgi:hypothetical protein